MEDAPTSTPATTTPDILTLSTELTMAWLSNPNTRANPEDVPSFLEKMHGAISGLQATPKAGAEEAEAAPQYEPAVSVRKSLASKDHIISMIDGKPYKLLRRHLAGHGLTPEQYRERYNLKPDYPMVSETYAQSRREMAKTIGLGRKPKAADAVAEPAPKSASKAPAKPKADKAPKADAKAPRAKKGDAAEGAAPVEQVAAETPAVTPAAATAPESAAAE